LPFSTYSVSVTWASQLTLSEKQSYESILSGQDVIVNPNAGGILHSNHCDSKDLL